MSEELLLCVCGVELDEDAALECVIVVTALADHGAAIVAEELLERDLADLLIAAKSLDVDAVVYVVRREVPQTMEQRDGGGFLLVVSLHCRDDKRVLALDQGLVILVLNHKMFALRKCINDGAERLEAPHTLEAGYVLDGDGAVVRTVKLHEKMLISSQVLI